MSQDPQLFTVKEASEYLGIPVPALYKLLKDGNLDSIKESPRKTLIRLEDLENYKNGVVPSEDFSQEIPEDVHTPKIGDRLKLSNIENKLKVIWVINDDKFEPAQVDSEFTGIVDNIIQHEGREFVYLMMENGSSRYCILGEQVREGLYPIAEEIPEEIPEEIIEKVDEPSEDVVEPSEEPSEDVSKEVMEEDDEEPTEKLKELMKPSERVESDLEKLIEEDDNVWQLVKSCDQGLKDYIKEKGDGSDTVGYTLELGARKLIYQPGGTYTEFDWPTAMEWFLTNRYLIWKMLKKHNVITKDFIEKVEKEFVVREEIKIR